MSRKGSSKAHNLKRPALLGTALVDREFMLGQPFARKPLESLLLVSEPRVFDAQSSNRALEVAECAVPANRTSELLTSGLPRQGSRKPIHYLPFVDIEFAWQFEPLLRVEHLPGFGHGLLLPIGQVGVRLLLREPQVFVAHGDHLAGGGIHI